MVLRATGVQMQNFDVFAKESLVFFDKPLLHYKMRTSRPGGKFVLHSGRKAQHPQQLIDDAAMVGEQIVEDNADDGNGHHGGHKVDTSEEITDLNVVM